MLAAREAPSVLLLGATCGRVAVTCQVLGSRSVVCVDGCRLPGSGNVSGLMRSERKRKQLLGPVGLAKGQVGGHHAGGEICCFVMATCVRFAQCARMSVLCPVNEQPSPRCRGTHVIKEPAGEVQ